jgi:hypothetical protein
MRSSAVAAELARCAPWLQAAIRRAPVTDSDWLEVQSEVLGNRATLWAGDRSCMVTQLLTNQITGELVVFVWLASGDLRELLAMRPVVESWGRQQGAASAWINGRLGWSRVLTPFGFRPEGNELRKVL